MGDNIIIRTVPDVTVVDYQVGTQFSVSDFQTPVSSAIELPINKAKAALWRTETVDIYQSDLDLASIFADETSQRLQIAMDSDLLADLPAQITVNQGATAGRKSGNVDLGTNAAPIGLTEDNITKKILNLGRVLDEQNVPNTGRWIVMPAWGIELMKNSLLRDASVSGDSTSMLRTGLVGQFDRFMVYQSNVLDIVDAATDYWNIMAGHSAGLAWASQITELTVDSNPFAFGQLLKSLCVYGFKVVEPKYLALLRAYEDLS